MRVLLAQMTPEPGDVAANEAALAAALEESAGIDLAVFPELFLEGYDPAFCREAARPAAEALAPVSRAAARAGTAVAVGFAERLGPGEAANSVGLVDADGEIAAVYRKTQLSGPIERESFTPGREYAVARLAGRAVAPLNCFDVEFPEPARAVARAGAELLVTVSANMAPYAAEQRLAVRARALENRLPHVYVNRSGAEGGNRFVGGSCVVDVFGEVRAEADPGDLAAEAAPRALVCEVPLGERAAPDVDFLKHIREPLPVQRSYDNTAKGNQHE